jgi:hypothetical protein
LELRVQLQRLDFQIHQVLLEEMKAASAADQQRREDTSGLDGGGPLGHGRQFETGTSQSRRHSEMMHTLLLRISLEKSFAPMSDIEALNWK